MSFLDLEVTGMTCISCSNTIRNILLKNYEYIDEVEVNIIMNKVRVVLNRKITCEERKNICNSINNAGFNCTLRSGTMMSDNMLSLSIDNNIIGSLDEKYYELKEKSLESEIIIATPNKITEVGTNNNRSNGNLRFLKLNKLNSDKIKRMIKFLENEKGIVSIIIYMKWDEVCILFDESNIDIIEIGDILSLKLGIDILDYIKFYTFFDNNKLNCMNSLSIKTSYTVNDGKNNSKWNIFSRVFNKFRIRRVKNEFTNDFTKSVNFFISGLFGIYDINVENREKYNSKVSIELIINIKYNPYFISSKNMYNYLVEQVIKNENIIKDKKYEYKLMNYEQIIVNNDFNNNIDYKELQKIKDKESRYYVIRFTISLILTILVLLLNYFGDKIFVNNIAKTLSFNNINSLKYEGIIPGISWNYLIIFILVTIIVYFCGYPFHKKGIFGLINLSPNMYTLISLGMNTCYAYSLYMMIYIAIVSLYDSNKNPIIYTESFPNFFDTACMLNTISLFGRILDIQSSLLILKILNDNRNIDSSKENSKYKINNDIKLVDNVTFKSLKKIYYSFSNNSSNGACGNNCFYQILPNLIKENKMEECNDTKVNKESIEIDNDRFCHKSNQSLEMKEESFITEENKINIDMVDLGDTIILNKNDIVPFDGVSISNEICILDESMITGETKVIEKLYGNYITSGSRVLSERLVLYITEIGTESTLGKIKKLKTNAKENHIPLPSSIDVFSKYFIPIILTISILSFIIWFSLAYFDKVNPENIIRGDKIDFLMNDNSNINIFDRFPISSKIMFALHFTLSVLAISCPCVIGLTIPIAILISTSITSKKNILVQNNNVINVMGCIDYVIFDKTGTLTNGKPSVKSIIVNHDNLKKINLDKEENSHLIFNPVKINVETFYVCDKNDNIDELFNSFIKLWWIIGSCEYYNNHPAGNVLRSFSIKVSRQIETNPSFSQPIDCKYHPGLGISCTINKMRILLTNQYKEDKPSDYQNYILKSLDTTGYYNYINNYNVNVGLSKNEYKNDTICENTCIHFNSNKNRNQTNNICNNNGCDNNDLYLNNWFKYWKKQGSSVIFVFFNDNTSEKSEMKLLGAISLSDEPMFGVESTINYIKKHITKQIWLCSGDSYYTSNSIASMVSFISSIKLINGLYIIQLFVIHIQVGIDPDKIMSNSSPNDKLSLVRDLQVNNDLNKTIKIDFNYDVNLTENIQLVKPLETDTCNIKANHKFECNKNANKSHLKKKKRKKVMMIGDGLNDSASLEASDVGILLGKGGICNFTNADVVILSNYQHNLKYLFKLSRYVKR
ncbi:P-type ATPase 2 [Cryptosporidium bovis]|uniref:P-type ATPase 2 n=1 Tax=Cryptosporidium bovis TaxID=310047 RepID=UPI00351A16C6|nr:P-type ATPase 2 [Cryptosporidium bovis]